MINELKSNQVSVSFIIVCSLLSIQLNKNIKKDKFKYLIIQETLGDQRLSMKVLKVQINTYEINFVFTQIDYVDFFNNFLEFIEFAIDKYLEFISSNKTDISNQSHILINSQPMEQGLFIFKNKVYFDTNKKYNDQDWFLIENKTEFIQNLRKHYLRKIKSENEIKQIVKQQIDFYLNLNV